MDRKSFRHSGLTFSYLDAGGDGELIVALHALWMEAGTWQAFAAQVAPEWRVVALDQRGHGRSDQAPSATWGDYVGDIGAFLEHLGAKDPVVLLGNSLGGTAAFLFAAEQPERVRALIAEEAPAKEEADLGFMLAWQGVFPTRRALLDRVGERLAWSVEPSIREVPGGFSLAFSPKELVERQHRLNGNFWHEWRASRCPALVLRQREPRGRRRDLGGDGPSARAHAARLDRSRPRHSPRRARVVLGRRRRVSFDAAALKGRRYFPVASQMPRSRPSGIV